MSIQEVRDKIKVLYESKHFQENVLLVLVITLVGSACFLFGRLSNTASQPTKSVVITGHVETFTNSLATNETPATIGQGEYVASRNGTKYYPPNCGSAKRINEENKVWFATQEEAELAGFTKSSTCTYE